MSKFILCVLVSLSIINAQDIVRIMSFNFPTAKQNQWEKIGTTLKVIDNPKQDRLKSAEKIIQGYIPTFVCFQETHKPDIQNFLKNDFIKAHYNSYAPSINNKDSETNAIFYSKDYNLIDKGIIFLNEKQKKGLKSWDDNHQRACTWIFVQNKIKPMEKFYIFNIHLGLTKTAKDNGLKIIYEKANILKSQGINSFIAGDFNMRPETVISSIQSYNFVIIRNAISSDKIFGPEFTYSGYDGKSKKTLDHIIVSIPEKIKPLEFRTITNSGARPSDHFPIMATIQLI